MQCGMLTTLLVHSFRGATAILSPGLRSPLAKAACSCKRGTQHCTQSVLLQIKEKVYFFFG